MVTLALAVTTAATFAVFLCAFVWNGVTSTKRRMTPEEAAEFATGRPIRASPDSVFRRSWSWSWFRGRAWGFAWSDEMGFAELKRGVKSGAWRTSVHIQQFLVLVVSFTAGIVSLTLLIGWLTRPAGLFVAIGLAVYVLVQMTRGFASAR